MLTPQQATKLLGKFTQQELADIFKRDKRTIRRWKKGRPEPQKVGRKAKLKENHISYLRDCITNAKTTTQKHLAWYFSSLMCESVSQPTICRTLKRVGITYKKVTHQSLEQLRQRNRKKIKYFIEVTLPSLLQSNANIFFLDEGGFHLNLVPRRGYSPKGSRLITQRPGNKGKNQTLIFLIQITNGKKIIHSKLIEGGLDSEKFHEFLSDFNPPNNGKKNVLIMDNLSVHHATKSCIKLELSTIEELARSKGIEIIFLPPYTPELNPVEKIFNIIRQYTERWQPLIRNFIRSKNTKEQQSKTKHWLDSIIKEKIKFFQKENLNNYLDNSIKECLMKNPDIGSDEHGYITMHVFNVRLMVDEPIKVRINDYLPKSNNKNLEKNDDPVLKIAKINMIVRSMKSGHSFCIK